MSEAARGREYLKEVSREMGLPITEKEIDRYKKHNPDTAHIKPIEEFEQALIKRVLMPESERGLVLPWKKTNEYFRLREGELTIWTGIRFHGKSSFLNQVLLGISQQGESSCVCSFEMKTDETLERMCYQWVGTNSPTVPFIKQFISSHKGRIFFYDQVGSITPDRMLAIAKYCAIELKIKHLVIDSLMKCRISSRDFTDSEFFVNDLQNIAKDYRIHIHLVAHQTKANDHSAEDAIRGSGMVPDIADNIWEIRKDVEKFEKEASNELSDDDEDTPDFYAKITKQRHSSVVVPRTFGFWKHSSLQFKPYSKSSPLNNEDWEQGRWT